MVSTAEGFGQICGFIGPIHSLPLLGWITWVCVHSVAEQGLKITMNLG